MPALQVYTGRSSGTPQSAETSTYPAANDPLPDDTPLPISHAVEFLADSLAEQGKTEEAAELFSELEEKHDRIRAAYWRWRKASL